MGLSPAAAAGGAGAEQGTSVVPARWGGLGRSCAPRAVFSRNKHAGDEGIYLPGDLTFIQNSQEVSQELLSRLIDQNVCCARGLMGASSESYLNGRKRLVFPVRETAAISDHLITCFTACAVCCGEVPHTSLTGSH